jgi:predicted nuclease of predicted toxin-antitoxin system
MAMYLVDECISHRIATCLGVAGYKVTSVHDSLYSRASDQEIVEWCRQNGAILVTKDYQLKRKKLHAAMLRQHAVSVVFFRERRAHWQLKDWYFQIFRQIDRLEQEFSSTSSPKYLVCRTTGKPQPVQL